MFTLVTDSHVYHTDLPPTKQANDRFAHRTDWFEHCSLCNDVMMILACMGTG